jgi:glyoxylase-like metal-dependent hydrolase (beta-lactamase superfamily II)
VENERVEVVPEHRSPEGFLAYQELKRGHQVVGMTTFPNSVLLRGAETILVDPGLHLQNEPVVRSLATRGVAPAAVELIALTHAHLDHAGACADLPRPVAVHELELRESHWAAVRGILEGRQLRLLEGDEGELVPGISWVRTPGHSCGSVCYRVETDEGLVVLVGDTIGPLKRYFDEMRLPDGWEDGEELLAAWALIRSWRPVRVIAGHLPPFAVA